MRCEICDRGVRVRVSQHVDLHCPVRLTSEGKARSGSVLFRSVLSAAAVVVEERWDLLFDVAAAVESLGPANVPGCGGKGDADLDPLPGVETPTRSSSSSVSASGSDSDEAEAGCGCCASDEDDPASVEVASRVAAASLAVSSLWSVEPDMMECLAQCLACEQSKGAL